MPNITVKNVPSDVYERVRQLAAANRRSINSEIIVCLERAVGGRSTDLEAMLEDARALRERTARYTISDEELDAAKREGRP